MPDHIRVIVWNENRHEKQNEVVAGIYPHGIHGAIASHLQSVPGLSVETATLDEHEHGLTEERLAQTDVLIWWGHLAHHEVADWVVDRIYHRVLAGMGLIVLHSGHHSKIFRRLMGTSCDLKWREAQERERLWVVDPAHPITDGINESIVLEKEEMYGERFDVPTPDQLIFISWFQGGEVFRSGCCYHRGRGKVFYFRPGHETYPTYHHPDILRVIANATRWAAPSEGPQPHYGYAHPQEPLQ